MIKLYHFIGSIYFTLLLIPLTALVVGAGTLIESMTQSHRHAASLTYDHPLFNVLLLGFFANILISALRRWPFKKRHIPFLLTHLGLLMVIAGVVVKINWGLQGAIIVWEGSASNQVLSSQEDVVAVFDRSGKTAHLPVRTDAKLTLHGDVWTVQELVSNSKETTSSWIFDNALHINGLPPLQCNADSFLPLTALRLHRSSAHPWNIHIAEVDQLWKQIAHITIREKQNSEILFQGRFDEAPNLALEHHDDGFFLRWNYPPYHVVLPLVEGSVTQDLATPYLGTSPIEILVEAPASIAFQKNQEQVILGAINQKGAIATTKPNAWVTYDQGFGGVYAQITIPFDETPDAPAPLEKSLKMLLEGMDESQPLSPPIQFLRENTVQLADVFVAFLQRWDRTHEWFYPLNGSVMPGFPQLNWSGEQYKACYWTIEMIQPLLNTLEKGIDLEEALKIHRWPLTHDLKNESIENALTYLSQQIFMIASRLPEPPPYHEHMNQRLFSAYLRAYGIHLSALAPPLVEKKEKNLPKIESPVITTYEKLEPLAKWEDNIPLVILGNREEQIALSYDPSGKKIPKANKAGSALFRYQPKPIAIPYTIRMHQATRYNYANSNQAKSYCCTAFINDEPATLSMNNVYETWDGYRFYLAAISPEAPGQVHQVRIVVNRDPAKYWLTYPGCMILVLGIALFSTYFWGNTSDSKIEEEK